MIAVDVHRLLVVRQARELRAGMGLVQAYVDRLEGALGEVDDGVMDVEPVERPGAGEGEGPHPALLVRPEARAFVGPDVVLLGPGPAAPSTVRSRPRGRRGTPRGSGKSSRRSSEAASMSSVPTRPSSSTQPSSCQVWTSASVANREVTVPPFSSLGRRPTAVRTDNHPTGVRPPDPIPAPGAGRPVGSSLSSGLRRKGRDRRCSIL